MGPLPQQSFCLAHAAHPNEEYEAAAQKLVDQWAGDIGFALDFMQGKMMIRAAGSSIPSISHGSASTDIPPEAAQRSNSAARIRAAKPCSAWIHSCVPVSDESAGKRGHTTRILHVQPALGK